MAIEFTAQNEGPVFIFQPDDVIVIESVDLKYERNCQMVKGSRLHLVGGGNVTVVEDVGTVMARLGIT